MVNGALLYLLPVLAAAVALAKGPALFAAGLGVMAFDFFFVPPVMAYAVGDVRYVLSFAVFLLVAAVTARLATRLREEAQAARSREATTRVLFQLSDALTRVRTLDGVAHELVRNVRLATGLWAAVGVRGASGTVAPWVASDPWDPDAPDREAPSPDAADPTDTPPPWVARAQDTVPIVAGQEVFGTLWLKSWDDRPLTPEGRRLAEALVGVAAMAFRSVKTAQEAEHARIAAEAERLRTALLDSLSHELRTPLAAILGFASGLAAPGAHLPEGARGSWSPTFGTRPIASIVW